ncbi:NACHT, LRR and PYD domains-containing protein 12-like [Hoplias malabaricus]|uniref:NACHT, LRR and PYD domains-containing protein 12-like n=1 Tax=Hoplias malabaricus TaxID=27720 RepID=UPI003461CFDE
MGNQNSSSGGGTWDSILQKQRLASPEPSCVSLKSDWSLPHPPAFSGKGGEPSCVSLKSDWSLPHPPAFSGKGGEPSCVSLKSDWSLPHPPAFSGKGGPPSCVSLKSDWSLPDRPAFSGKGGEPSCVSLKSDWSLPHPPAFNGKGGEPSCVSLKSDWSLPHPPAFSGKGGPPSCVSVRCGCFLPDRPAFSSKGGEPSCVSLKSDWSLQDPPVFIGKGGPPSCVSVRRGWFLPDRPAFSGKGGEPSCVSLKSDQSKGNHSTFSGRAVPSDPEWRMNDQLQGQSRCGLGLHLLTDPVSISCGHSFCRQCISSFWDRSPPSEDFVCPQCKTISRTRLVPRPHKVSMEQGSHQPADDVLHRVSERHRTILKNRYESLFEGIRTPENKTLLNSVYTQLYIIEGESEGVNEEHEVLQMEKTPRRHQQDAPIHCSDIFKPLQGPDGGVKAEDLRLRDRKEDKGAEEQEIRRVLTKGIAGIGKTVSVQKFILDWAEGAANQEVDLMFVLLFRELNLIKDDQYSLHGLLCAFHPELRDLDPEIYDQLRTVFIFDGLDESRVPLDFEQCEKVSDITMTSSVGVLMTNLIRGDLLPSALIWITSRPAAANQIPPRYIHRVTEIQGLTDPQKEEYFRKRIRDQDQAQKIISHIKTARSLHIMCHIPIFCWISATVLQRIITQCHTEIPKTLTEMYSNFLLTQTNMKKEKYEEKEKRDKRKLLESNRTELLKLAELAFTQLLKGIVMFYEEDLRESSIDVNEASVYSGIFTEIFREECVIHQRKVYCFVHLSFQEFLAAVFVFHCFQNDIMEPLQCFKPQYKERSDDEMNPLGDIPQRTVDKEEEEDSQEGELNSFFSEVENSVYESDSESDADRDQSEEVSLDYLLWGAVKTAVKSQNGRLDLFLRFLLGLSLESNQSLLQGLLTPTHRRPERITEYIKRLIKRDHNNPISTERSINLFLCLSEMKDQSLYREIEEFLNSEKHSDTYLSPGQCSALTYILLNSEEELEKLDLGKYRTSAEGYRRLIQAVAVCRKAQLSGCELTKDSCESLGTALQSENSLKELDLSNNDLQDSGVELLSALKSPLCKLETLRLTGCRLGDKSCESLGSVLQSNSSLKELDFSNNVLQDSGVELLSAALKSPLCKLETLRLALCGLRDKSCESLGSVLQSENSLKELDLSNNDLRDSGVERLSAALKSPLCKLETLRLSGCMISGKSCSSLASSLKSNPFHLRKLDLSYNHPGESGVKLLSDLLQDPHCALKKLQVEHRGKIRMKPELRKYACDLTLDPNTAHTDLSLSEGNRKVEWEETRPYPDHLERYDHHDRYRQVQCVESLTGRCYWEVEWRGGWVYISVSHRKIRWKGHRAESVFGSNNISWCLICSEDNYWVSHNKQITDIPRPPSDSNRVGVYLDCGSGTLSFYAISTDTHTLTHLYTFTSTFTEPLYAGFGFDVPDSSARLCEIE